MIINDNKAVVAFDQALITNDNSKASQILSTREVLELVEFTVLNLSHPSKKIRANTINKLDKIIISNR